MNSSFSTIGVCVFDIPPRNAPRTVSYPQYIHEILRHAGLYYKTVAPDALAEFLGTGRLLVTVGNAEFSDETGEALRQWVEAGGAWLSIGGICGMPDLFGVAPREAEYTGVAWGGYSVTLGEGYLQTTDARHPALADVPLPLHFFNGIAVTATAEAKVLATALDAHQRPDAYVGMVERTLGEGRCVLIAPDVIGSIVRIQQGTAVTRDGVPARDGTAVVSDGLLKCDDGMVLDWIFDRQEVPGTTGLRCFLEPIADHWRSVLLRTIFYLAREHDVPLVLLWLYPRNLPALGHLSHDSDHNVPELAKRLLEVTAEEEAPATWCIILPGYSPEIIEAIKGGGHELATHYDAMDHEWSEAEFDSQWRALCEQFGEKPVSNKNHYTRWEGDTEFFEWCVTRGLQLDGSKGPSKFGEAGFNFGTSLPYFPVAPDGTPLDILELPFLTQDLGIFITDEVIPSLVKGVLGSHGVMHLLFHPSHIGRDTVAEALRKAVRAGRAAGMEWWTSRQINDWERARRGVQWGDGAVSGNMAATLQSDRALEQATILVFNSRVSSISFNGESQTTEKVRRWGVEFTAVTVDVRAGFKNVFAVG